MVLSPKSNAYDYNPKRYATFTAPFLIWIIKDLSRQTIGYAYGFVLHLIFSVSFLFLSNIAFSGFCVTKVINSISLGACRIDCSFMGSHFAAYSCKLVGSLA